VIVYEESWMSYESGGEDKAHSEMYHRDDVRKIPKSTKSGEIAKYTSNQLQRMRPKHANAKTQTKK
jgi:hypothetical protein